MCVCVRACVRAGVRVCVHMCTYKIHSFRIVKKTDGNRNKRILFMVSFARGTPKTTSRRHCLKHWINDLTSTNPPLPAVGVHDVAAGGGVGPHGQVGRGEERVVLLRVLNHLAPRLGQHRRPAGGGRAWETYRDYT